MPNYYNAAPTIGRTKNVRISKVGIYSQPTPANSTEETEKDKTNIEYKWIYYYA